MRTLRSSRLSTSRAALVAATAAALSLWLPVGAHAQVRDEGGRAPGADATRAREGADVLDSRGAGDAGPKSPAEGQGGTSKGSRRGDGGVPRFDGYDRERWESLADEDRERLRAALREIWTDPQVISAREEVQQASNAYREAVREAMERVDPSAVALLREMQSDGEGRSRERLGSAPPGSPGHKGRGGYRPPEFSAVGPPGFLERFPPKEQERFRRAEAKAQGSERVESARSRLGELREQDESLRKKRFEAHLDLRRGLFEAIVAEDPGLRGMIESLERQLSPPSSQREPERWSPGRRGGTPEGDGDGAAPREAPE